MVSDVGFMLVEMGRRGRRHDDDREMKVVRRYDSLLAELQQLPRRCMSLLVAVDGCGGSGKSTFAGRLQALDATIMVIHMDDFYLPSAQRQANPQTIADDYDTVRLSAEVLTPLTQNQPAHYQRYDWPADRLAEFHTVSPGDMVIVEGVSALLPVLVDAFDYKVWVECPYELRLARGLARDGEAARSWWEDYWMPAEQRYIQAYSPVQCADLMVDGSAELGDEFAISREAKR